MMAVMATTAMGKWNTTEGDEDDNDDNDNVNIDVIEDNGDDGTTMMRWRKGRMDDDDAMAMGGQQPAERS